MFSIYSAFQNNPLLYRDALGDTVEIGNDGKVIRNQNTNDGILVQKAGTSFTRIELNDNIDLTQINEAKVGAQLVRILDEDNVNWFLDDAGANNIRNQMFPEVALFAGAVYNFDYGLVYLVPNIAGKSPAEDIGADDQYGNWDGQGGLIMFKGDIRPRVYNIPDAGNFLFGVTAYRLGMDAPDVLGGAQAYSQATTGKADTKADQVAIYAGWLYGNHLRLEHNKKYTFGYWYDYTTVKPTWIIKK